MAKKAKPPTGWRWSNTDTTLAYMGGEGFSVAIDELRRDGRTVYVTIVIHDATDPAGDDRVEELGAFEKYVDANNARFAYVSRRTGEPEPDYERFDPTAR